MSPRATWVEARWWGAVAALAAGVGVVLRVRAVLQGRPLWLDEAMLALNVMSRDYAGLLRPLDYDQAAPPLFLWLAHWLGTTTGGVALALRMLPLLAGVVALPLVWWFGRTVFCRAVGAVATVLVALSPSLIYYSTEFKPYMGDATITLALLGLAWVAADEPPGRRWWLLLGAGLLALGFSLAAPFALAGAGTLLLVRGRSLGASGRTLTLHAVMGGVWLGAFSLLYLFVLRPAAANAYLQGFWAAEFLSAQPTFRLALYNVSVALSLPMPVPAGGGVPMTALLPVLGLLGLLAWRRFGLLRFVPWLALVGAALAASALRFYPVDGRLMLFAAGLTLVVVAAGLVALAERLPARASIQLGLLGAAVLLPVVWAGAPLGRGPGSAHPPSTAIAQVLERPPAIPVYVLTGAGPQYVYYSTDWSAPDSARLAWYAREMSWGGRGFRNAQDPSRDRTRLTPPGHPMEILAHASGTQGEEVDSLVERWADAEVDDLLDLAVPEVWVVGGRYQDRELPHLEAALRRRGIPWRVLHRSASETVLALRLGAGAERPPGSGGSTW